MAEVVVNCPRCGAQRVTHDVKGSVIARNEYGSRNFYEVLTVCRGCERGAIYVLRERTPNARDFNSYTGGLNLHFDVVRNISTVDNRTIEAPEHLPKTISNAFKEGAACIAIGCWNAAATMFRLCIDLATKDLLPPDGTEGITSRQRRDLGLRLQWLFDQQKLPASFRELAACIQQDGNDGAHAGILTKVDSEDVLDFSIALLERLYTEPERLRLSKERRDARRALPR